MLLPCLKNNGKYCRYISCSEFSKDKQRVYKRSIQKIRIVAFENFINGNLNSSF